MKNLFIAVVLAMMCLSTVQADNNRRNEGHTAKHHVKKGPARLAHLPKGHHVIKHGGKSFFFNDGRWYHHSGGAYLSIVAPIGARVTVLPTGYLTFGIGLRRYFYLGGTYYRHVGTGYEVISKPPEAEQVLSSSGSDTLIVYPAGGQTPEQSKRDKYECHEWSSQQSGYDPTSENSDPAYRSDYNRGMGACLEARNYVVK